MSHYLLKCGKCKQVGVVVYYCCQQGDKVCYNCAKDLKESCIKCGKKKIKPFSNSRIGTQFNKQNNQFTCRFCKKTFEKMNNFAQFDCKHVTCFRCLGKKIQGNVKSGSWEIRYNQNPSKLYVECNCQLKSRFEVKEWMKEHCFYCGENFFQRYKIQLKYGLVIMQFCRNKLLFENDPSQILSSHDINSLSKECKSCSNLIDGYRRTVGLEDSFGCECSDCLTSEVNRVRRREISRQEMENCIICKSRQDKSSMVLMENFYLCRHCYDQSMKKQAERRKSVPKEPSEGLGRARQKVQMQQKRDKVIEGPQCFICQEKIVNPVKDSQLCQKCMRLYYSSPLVQQLEKSMKAGQDNQNKKPPESNNNKTRVQGPLSQIKKQNQSPFKKTKVYEQQLTSLKRNYSNPNEKAKLQCVRCDRNLQVQSIKSDSHFAGLLCNWCIQENEKGAVDFKRNGSQSASNARIREKHPEKNYRPAREHKTWRKTTSYLSFLKESQDPFIPNHGNEPKIAGSPARSRISSVKKRGEVKRSQKVMESIIQEFPDVDHLEVAEYKQSTAGCSICRCILTRNNLLNYKTVHQQNMNLCLYCYLLCQAKKW